MNAVLNTNLDVLPPVCWIYVESENVVAMIKRGASGYIPVGGKDDPDENKRLVADQNKSLGIKASEEEAMRSGSLCGWDLPIANPSSWLILDYIADLEAISPEIADHARQLLKEGMGEEQLRARFKASFREATASS